MDLYVWYCWHLKYDRIKGKIFQNPVTQHLYEQVGSHQVKKAEESQCTAGRSAPFLLSRRLKVSNRVEESWSISCGGQQLPRFQVCPKCSLSSDLSASCCCKLQKGRSPVLFFVCFLQKKWLQKLCLIGMNFIKFLIELYAWCTLCVHCIIHFL